MSRRGAIHNRQMTTLLQLVRRGGRARLAVYLIALWKLIRHPQTPRPAKWVAIGVLAYALSPIDLIPDFVPVLGQLDDIIIVPLGIMLAVRLTPRSLWEALLLEAETSAARLPNWRTGLWIVVALWALLLGLLGWAVYRAFQ